MNYKIQANAYSENVKPILQKINLAIEMLKSSLTSISSEEDTSLKENVVSEINNIVSKLDEIANSLTNNVSNLNTMAEQYDIEDMEARMQSNNSENETSKDILPTLPKQSSSIPTSFRPFDTKGSVFIK